MQVHQCTSGTCEQASCPLLAGNPPTPGTHRRNPADGSLIESLLRTLSVSAALFSVWLARPHWHHSHEYQGPHRQDSRICWTCQIC